MIRLPNAVQAYFSAVNASHPGEFLAAFDNHALILDNKREIKGQEAIRAWSATDVFGPNVRFDITEASGEGDSYTVTAAVDGDFDKTNLPDPLLLMHTFRLSGNKIKELVITLP